MQQLYMRGIFMSDKKRLAKAVAAGAFCGLLTSVLLMCLFAAVMLKIGLLDSAMLDAVLAALFGFGALAGGFAAAKLNKGAGLVAGALTGAAMLLLLLLTAAVRNQADFSSVFLMKLAAALLGGSAGGVLAMRERRHPKL